MILGIPWVNGLDDIKSFSSEFLHAYFAQSLYLGKPIYFPHVVDASQFQIAMWQYRKGHVSLYAMSKFLRLVEEALECGESLSRALDREKVDFVVLNYSWLAPLVPKLATANGGDALRSVCEVHDFQSKQNLFRRWRALIG